MQKYLNKQTFLGSNTTFTIIKKAFFLKNSNQRPLLQNKKLLGKMNIESHLSPSSKKPWWKRKLFTLLISLAGLIGLVSLGMGGVIIGGVLHREPIVEAAKLEPVVIMLTGIRTNNLTFADEGLLLYSSDQGINSFNIFNKKDENLIPLTNFVPSELVDLTYHKGKIALAWNKKVDLYNQAGQLIESHSEPKMLISSVHLSDNIMLIVYHPQDVPQNDILKTEFVFYDLLTNKIISRHYIPGSRQVIDVLINEKEAYITAENSYQYIPPAAITVTMFYKKFSEKFYQLADLQILPGAKKAVFDKDKKLFWLDNIQPSNIKEEQKIIETGKNLLLGRFNRQLFSYDQKDHLLKLLNETKKQYDLSIAKELILLTTGQLIKTDLHQYFVLPGINSLGEIEIVLLLN